MAHTSLIVGKHGLAAMEEIIGCEINLQAAWTEGAFRKWIKGTETRGRVMTRKGTLLKTGVFFSIPPKKKPINYFRITAPIMF